MCVLIEDSFLGGARMGKLVSEKGEDGEDGTW